VRRYNWHSAGSLDWPFPTLKYSYIFRKKIYGSNFIKQHSETVIVRVTKMLIEKKRIVSFIMIFGTLSFHIQ